ncbi:nucleolar complex protein 3 homolog isoform X1 [Neodiprion lecontei]|uniref:NOC3-like protein n=1 Tax=Neodiprion lecontei TaxID=441921 RepID=A0A6J0C461_NEOLC|nr:nucleolar complex protein 3 homolog isoform X1 [Neodiprion lecontei]
MGKIAKSKISKIKRNNQTRTKLSKQGKLKSRRNRKTQKQLQQPPTTLVSENVETEDESDHGEDMLGMVEKDDLEFLKKAVSNQSYNLLNQITLNQSEPEIKRKRKKSTELDDLEEKYENATVNTTITTSRTRMLLPIKSQNKLIERHIPISEIENFDTDEQLRIEQDRKSNGLQSVDEEELTDQELNLEYIEEGKIDVSKPVSMVELLACREEVLQSRRFKIGILSSGLLENPELKAGNLKVLLSLMEEEHPEVYITVRKLAMVSLLEVFKDILPSYSIKQIPQDKVKLKRETLNLQNYEAVMLKSYKLYLQKLEKFASMLNGKKLNMNKLQKQEIILGEIAITCMSELLIAHPYFNFSVNIANLLVPYLDSKWSNVREIVAKCVTQIFKEDKRGELSLVIVRRINQYIKTRGHSVYVELLTVLLVLKISDINLDKGKEEELKQKKLQMHKQKLISMSKRERKRKKKLEQVEKEMIETKAEENKQSKQRVLTDITSIVFTIYFRILKQIPTGKILSVTLQGLAKFAHSINIEFYQDLVNVLNRLLEGNTLTLREQLYCIETVFVILSGQGEALNIDPSRFYSHLYRNLLGIHAGKNHADLIIILRTLGNILIKKRKNISQNRLIAFLKRISILALQLEHNGTLGILAIIKIVMQLGKATDILLDTDSSIGEGFYDSVLNEPEYCNAQRSAFWELVPLQRHYHPMVQKMAKNIARGVPTSGEGSLEPEFGKLSPVELFDEYKTTGVMFKPAVTKPKKVISVKFYGYNHHITKRYEDYFEDIFQHSRQNDTAPDFHGSFKLKNFKCIQ